MGQDFRTNSLLCRKCQKHPYQTVILDKNMADSRFNLKCLHHALDIQLKRILSLKIPRPTMYLSLRRTSHDRSRIFLRTQAKMLILIMRLWLLFQYMTKRKRQIAKSILNY